MGNANGKGLNLLPITLLVVKTDSASSGQWERWKVTGRLGGVFVSARAADSNICSGHSYPLYVLFTFVHLAALRAQECIPCAM